MTAPHSVSSWQSSDGSDPVSTYARDVVEGRIPAGQWHKAACTRHLRDLETAESQGLVWKPWLAFKVVLFARLCRHFKGRKWAGRPVELEPWEVFIVGSLFGWVRSRDGFRRFVDAFIELPRGQGKSTLAAIILLFMTFFDNEPGADGYCYATKKDQARIVFRTARRFVLASPLLKKLITPYRSTLFNEETESKVDILGSDSDNQDGLRPHVAVADEVHRQKTPDMMEVVESGMGTLDQPLHFKITTAGESAESVYEQQVRISTQVLDGTVDIPEWFAFIAAADPEDDPELEETWRKANPNFGISVNPDFLRKEMRKAKANPYEWVKFRRLYLGQKVGAADGYLPLLDWDVCAQQDPVSDEQLRGLPCWLGLDLSSRIDLTAGVLVWLLPDGRCVWRPKFWVPEVGLEERRRRDRVPFTAWVEQGHIEATEGNVVHLGVVREWIVEQKAAWPLLQEVCYDPWGAGEIVQTLKDDHGMRVVEVRQGPRTLSEPMKRTQELVLEHDLDPSTNPVLRWNAGNLKARVDANDNVAPCKRKSRGRIDGMTAGITALSRALLQPVKKKSRYSDPQARVEAVSWK
jgi:phage terminase large subunit-like protein